MDNYKLQISPGTTIQLRKPKMMESKYELAIGEEVVGTIIRPKVFGTLAYVSSGKQEWCLERKGFWKTYITLRKKDQETDLLKFSFGRMSQKSFEDYIREQLPWIYTEVIGVYFEGDILNGIIDTIEDEYKKFLSKL